MSTDYSEEFNSRTAREFGKKLHRYVTVSGLYIMQALTGTRRFSQHFLNFVESCELPLSIFLAYGGNVIVVCNYLHCAVCMLNRVVTFCTHLYAVESECM